MPHRITGFSLIELLVVIAVVAVLIAILLPTLGSARDTARASVCMSNQRQTTLALLLYTQDYRGRFVTYAATAPGGLRWWFGFEPGFPNSGTNRPLDKTGSPLASYFGGDIQQGLSCPQFPRSDPRFVPKFAVSSAHFGYNGGLVWPAPINRRPRAISEVLQPSAVFAYSDAIHVDGSNAFYEPHEVAYRRPGRISGTAHFRHTDRANTAMLDGHVRPLPVPNAETVWDSIANAPVANLDATDGPGSIYGFPTWTSQ